MIVSYLPDPESHPLWPEIRDLLKPAAEFGGIPVFDEGDILWIAHEDGTVFAAATTLLWQDGEAELRLAGGTRFKEWMGLLDEVVSGWAASAGAAKITMRGRLGWRRFAKRYGWGLRGIEDGRWLYEKQLAIYVEQE